MRTITLGQQAALESVSRSEHVRVFIKSPIGQWVDMTNYYGRDWLIECSWGEDNDSPHITADVTLRREIDGLNISTLISGGPNASMVLGGAQNNTVVRLLAELKIEAAVVGPDRAPTSADWIQVFHGRIDKIGLANGENIRLECRDMAGLLADRFIERERVYAYAQSGTGGCRVWAPSSSFDVNELVMPTDARRSVASYYRCTSSSGTKLSGLAEPNWSSVPSSTYTDGALAWIRQGTGSTSIGTPVQTVIGQICTDNGVPTTVSVPVNPGWNIKWYLQKRVSVHQANRELMLQIGWDARMAWDAASGSFKYTLVQPDRDSTSVQHTFSADDYRAITRCDLDVAGVRNVIRVIYSDSTDLDPSGAPRRKEITVEDSASISAFGRLYMEVAEEAASQIDTPTEATNLANRCKSDLATPPAEQEVDLRFFPWAQLGDRYTFMANGIHYDTDLTAAVVGIRHTATNGGPFSTQLTCRGKPSTGFRRWHNASTNSSEHEPVSVSSISMGTFTTSVQTTIGGALVTATLEPSKNDILDGIEFHLSATSGFTPSSSTLKGVGKSRTFETGALVNGATYYGCFVPVGRVDGKVIRGQPSPEFSFVAGYVTPNTLQPGVSFPEYPANSNLEAHNDTAKPPDTWNMRLGTWSVNAIVDNSDSSAGVRSVSFPSGSTGMIESQRWVAHGGDVWEFSCWYKPGTGGVQTGRLIIEFLDRNGSIISGTYEAPLGNAASSTRDASVAGLWQRVSFSATAPSATAYARALVYHDISAYSVKVDGVRAARVSTAPGAWREFGYPTDPATYIRFQNSWGSGMAGWPTAAWRLSGDGRKIQLRGRVLGGSFSAAIAEAFPVGMRSTFKFSRNVPTNTGNGELQVNTDGTFQLNNGGNTWVDLTGVEWEIV